MAAYQLTSGTSVVREVDGAIIPDDPRNADWQVYQMWLAANNTPDSVPTPTASQAAATQLISSLVGPLTTTWSTSTTLNGPYAIDSTTQFNITAETVSILTNSTFTNGQTTRNWPTATPGVFVNMTVAQFKALATTVALYIDQAQSAYATAAAGQSATWPSTTTTINA